MKPPTKFEQRQLAQELLSIADQIESAATAGDRDQFQALAERCDSLRIAQEAEGTEAGVTLLQTVRNICRDLATRNYADRSAVAFAGAKLIRAQLRRMGLIAEPRKTHLPFEENVVDLQAEFTLTNGRAKTFRFIAKFDGQPPLELEFAGEAEGLRRLPAAVLEWGGDAKAIVKSCAAFTECHSRIAWWR